MELAQTRRTRPDSHSRAIRSYRRRGTRLNAGQQLAWDAAATTYVVAPSAHEIDGFRLTNAFARSAPLVIEIGFGVGEALAPLALGRPECNVFGFEVWQPGVAECLARVAGHDLANLRLSTWDATWCLERNVEPASVAELWTFFPDPWPKTRHHKRRLINPSFAALAASRLAPGGTWRLATDWPHYAEQIQDVLDAEPLLSGGRAERYEHRPLTRFERRGLAAGRAITDLTYRRGAE